MSRRKPRERVAWIIATASLLALMAALVLGRLRTLEPRAANTQTYQLSIVLPEGVRLSGFPAGRFAISP
ncbi:MAG: hypothetical protein DMF91_13430, partial [Acidobacteria bacterium]